MNKKTLFDKVYGCWLGKCIGGSAGAAVEGYKKVINQDFHTTMRPDLPNDDLDLQLLWFEVLQEKGLALRSKDLADAWNAHCWYPFSEYGIFLRNYDRGIWPSLSGEYDNPLFHDGEGCPIRSEIWAVTFPCARKKAAAYAEKDASLDHYGDSVWIEQFYAAMESEAFKQSDILSLIKHNLSFLPKTSRSRRCANLVLQYQEESWEQLRARVMQQFGHNDFTNSVTNLGIVLVALLKGQNDMEKTIDICYRSGFDTDCTCATSAALLGIITGASGIPSKLKEMVGDSFVCGIDIKSTNRSIKKLAEETTNFALNPYEGTTPPLTYNIIYPEGPTLGINKDCHFVIILSNNTPQAIDSDFSIDQLPSGWELKWTRQPIHFPGNSSILIENTASLRKEATLLATKNILTFTFNDFPITFGIIGANTFSIRGPYFEALDKPIDNRYPSPHGEGSVLPSLECMVNNAVSLQKEYGSPDDEKMILTCKTDMLPLDSTFPDFFGQGMWYISTSFISPVERDVWLTIGNNDGISITLNGEKIIEKDEIRLWTPYNNAVVFHMKKGENVLEAKLLRRTEHLQFSYAWRFYNNQHYHRQRYLTDLITILPAREEKEEKNK